MFVSVCMDALPRCVGRRMWRSLVLRVSVELHGSVRDKRDARAPEQMTRTKTGRKKCFPWGLHPTKVFLRYVDGQMLP